MEKLSLNDEGSCIRGITAMGFGGFGYGNGYGMGILGSVFQLAILAAVISTVETHETHKKTAPPRHSEQRGGTVVKRVCNWVGK